MEKFCHKCQRHLPESSYARHRNRSDGLSVWCLECQRAKGKDWYSRNKEKHKSKTTANRRKRVAEGSTHERDYQAAYRKAQRGSLLYEMRRRASDTWKRSHNPSLTRDIDGEFLVELWEAQKGLCALTGRQLILRGPSRDPWLASLDRIDPTRGYERDNVRFVGWFVNRARSNCPDDEFLQICRDIVHMAKRQAEGKS